MFKAVVTGAAGGIGKVVCEVLRSEGYKVYGFDLADGFDVTSFPNVLEHFAAVGKFDVLVNNAGISVLENFQDITQDTWKRHIDVNLNGPFNCCKAAIPYLGGGDIINMVSRAAVYFHPNHASYCASKAGLYALSEVMAMDLRNLDIRVTSIMPGPVKTGFAGQPRHEWQIDPENIAYAITSVLRMPRKASFGRVEIKPTHPGKM